MIEVPIKPTKIPKGSASITKGIDNMPKNTPGIAKGAIGMLIKRHAYARKYSSKEWSLICTVTRPPMLMIRGCKNKKGIYIGYIRRLIAGIQEEIIKIFLKGSLKFNVDRP